MLHPLTRSGRASRMLLALALGLASHSMTGCGTVRQPETPLAGGLTYRRVSRFAAEWEFDEYLSRVRRAAARQDRPRHNGAACGEESESLAAEPPSSVAPAQPAAAAKESAPAAVQGETRSHGFFFQPQADGGGLLGLPVRLSGRPGHHLVQGSAEVAFLRVSPELRFNNLGALAARAEGPVQDACVVSCVDWYGNARPIFFRGRIFALLGYELVEGSLQGGRLQEQRRIDYLQAAALRPGLSIVH